MLSRHAEDLFWIGRYVERAEDTARMLDVTYHGLLESPAAESGAAWRELLRVLYVDRVYRGELDATAVSRFLVANPDHPGSIVAAVTRARENARGVRDRISSELWEAVNAFHLELERIDLAALAVDRPYELLRLIKNRCQMVSGVAAQTMPRDDGYRFMLLGLLMERAEITCRLLAVRYASLARRRRTADVHAWVTVLKSVSAFEAYLKAYRASLEPTRVLEFLLISSEFPRSVLYNLRHAEQVVGLLTDEPDARPLLRRIGRLRAKAEYCDLDQIVEAGLDEFLEELQADIWDTAEALEEHFFRSGADLDLHAYESV